MTTPDGLHLLEEMDLKCGFVLWTAFEPFFYENAQTPRQRSQPGGLGGGCPHDLAISGLVGINLHKEYLTPTYYIVTAVETGDLVTARHTYKLNRSTWSQRISLLRLLQRYRPRDPCSPLSLLQQYRPRYASFPLMPPWFSIKCMRRDTHFQFLLLVHIGVILHSTLFSHPKGEQSVPKPNH